MPRKLKFSPWYTKLRAEDARAASRHMRPVDRKPGGNTDAKAREYATWLLLRDGLDLALLAHNTREAHKLSRHATMTAQVFWYPCAAGLRPRFVQFAMTDHTIRAPIHLARVELPHWSFEAADLNAPADEAPAALAA